MQDSTSHSLSETERDAMQDKQFAQLCHLLQTVMKAVLKGKAAEEIALRSQNASDSQVILSQELSD